ncbi:signal peptidase I [Candidatus Dependentiae bacterium]
MIGLRWLFNTVKRNFLNRKSEFLKKAQLLEDQGNKKESLYIKKLVKDIESKIEKLTNNFESGKVGSFKLFFRVRSLLKAYRDLKEGVKPLWKQLLETILVVGTIVIVLQKFFFTHYNVPTGSAEPNILVGDRIWGNKLAYRISEVERGDLVIFDNPLYSTRTAGPLSRFVQEKLGITIPLLGIGPDAWVKRVIAVPGDTVEGRIEDGKAVIYRNGKKLDEPYVNPYPLIAVKKNVGLVDSDLLRSIPILSWLATKAKEWRVYTYDRDKPLEDQPFYSLGIKEVLRNINTGEPYYREADAGEPQDEFGPMRVPVGKYWVMGDSRKNSADCRVWGFLDKSLIQGRASFITFSIDTEEPFFLLELLKHPIKFWTKKIRWKRCGRSLHPFKGLPKS